MFFVFLLLRSRNIQLFDNNLTFNLYHLHIIIWRVKVKNMIEKDKEKPNKIKLLLNDLKEDNSVFVSAMIIALLILLYLFKVGK